MEGARRMVLNICLPKLVGVTGDGSEDICWGVNKSEGEIEITPVVDEIFSG